MLRGSLVLLPLHLMFQFSSLCPLHKMVLGSHGINMCRDVFLLPCGRTPTQIKGCEIGKGGLGLTCFFHVVVGGTESTDVTENLRCSVICQDEVKARNSYLISLPSCYFLSYQSEAFAWLLMQNNEFRKCTSIKRLPTEAPSIISFS